MQYVYGAQGNTGLRGYRRFEDPMGAVGPQGAEGPMGLAGHYGEIGAQGCMGFNGSTKSYNCCCYDRTIVFMLQQAVTIYNNIVLTALRPSLCNDVIKIVIDYTDIRDYFDKEFIRRHPQYENIFRNMPISDTVFVSQTACLMMVKDAVRSMTKYVTIVTCDTLQHELEVCKCFDYDH